MNLQLRLTAHSSASTFMQIKYNDEILSLKDFAIKYGNDEDDFYLDKLSNEVVFIYKGNEMSLDNICKHIQKVSDNLPCFNLYYNKLFCKQFTYISDSDYFVAAGFYRETEKLFSAARYEIIQASRIIGYNVELNWAIGYDGYMWVQTMHLNNAIVNLQNIEDHILQTIYWGYGFYRHHPNYVEGNFIKNIDNCSKRWLNEYKKEIKNKELNTMWQIISKGFCKNTQINGWANAIKHKGGIKYIETELPPLFNLKITLLDGSDVPINNLSQTYNENYKKVLETVTKAYKTWGKVQEELYDFMDYESIEKKDYKKINL